MKRLSGKEAKDTIGEIRVERKKRTFKVYDMPIGLIDRLISYAKLYHGNQVWKVVEEGMDLLQAKETSWKVMTDIRLDKLEKEVFEKEKPKKSKTWGENIE